MKLPFVHDSTTGKPSITLFFPYATFFIACVSLITLHFKPALTVATWTSISFWVLATALYMLRKITKLKFDKGGVALENSTDEEKEDAPESAAKVDSPDAK
jgi:hypothetical protein